METIRLNTIDIDLNEFDEKDKEKVKEWILNNPMDNENWRHFKADKTHVFASKDGDIKILLSKQKAKFNNHGYIRYCINHRTIGAHRLVAFAWYILPTLEYNNSLDVDHVNNIKTDNRISNLRAINHKDNIIYRDAEGCPRNRAIKGINIENLNTMHFISIKEAAEKLNLKAPNICNCLKGKIKKTGGYMFEYDTKTRTTPLNLYINKEDEMDLGEDNE